MTNTELARVDGDTLIKLLRSKYRIKQDKSSRTARYVREQISTVLDLIMKEERPFLRLPFIRPFLRLPIVRRLPPWIRDTENRFLGGGLIPAINHFDCSFSSPAKLRNRNLSGRILGVLPYSIFDPIHGGQFRAHDIYIHLSKYFEIIALSLQWGPLLAQITPNLCNACYPVSQRQLSEQSSLETTLGPLSYPVAMIRNLPNSKEFLLNFDKLSRNADIIIFSHPYLFALAKKLRKDQIVVYDSTDIEYDVFENQIKGQTRRLDSAIFQLVVRAEREACENSNLIFATSAEHAKRLASLYAVPTGKMIVVSNPIETTRQNIPDRRERERRKAELGLRNRPVILYLASWHMPHIESLEFIMHELAPLHPEWIFLILGTVAKEICKPYMRGRVPSNIVAYPYPAMEDKTELYKIADLAVSPSTYGSGTEIKILVYMAAGLPIVTTQTGVRGLRVRDREHVIIAGRKSFERAIVELLNDEGLQERIKLNALQFVTRYRASEIAVKAAVVLRNAMKTDLIDIQSESLKTRSKLLVNEAHRRRTFVDYGGA